MRANKLNKKLIDRNVHQDVLNFCKSELMVNNYFHVAEHQSGKEAHGH